MLESQVELNEKRQDLFAKLCEYNPKLGDIVKNSVSQIFSDGVLCKKEKYLLALAVALGMGCRICILAQLTGAIAEGATRAEIMEVLAVVYSMKGTTGTAEGLRVVQYIEEVDLK